MIPDKHIMILQEQPRNGSFYYEHRYVLQQNISPCTPTPPSNSDKAVFTASTIQLSTSPALSQSPPTSLPSVPISLPPIIHLHKSGDLRSWFSKATPDDRLAMDRRMTEQWRLTIDERREADEEELARWKRQKTEGAANRKRAECARKMNVDIAAGRRSADGKLMKKVRRLSRQI
jgi:hypothetical protein